MNEYPGAAPTLVAIEVVPDSVSLIVGDQQQLSAIGLFSDGKTLDLSAEVAWSSNDPSVASMSPSGVVAAVGVGTIRLLARFDGILGQALLAVAASQAASEWYYPLTF